MKGQKRQSLVIWNDAHGDLAELTAAEVVARHAPHLVHTYGYIVWSDEVGVSIAAEWVPSVGALDETFRGITFVPRSMVIEERGARRRTPRASTA